MKQARVARCSWRGLWMAGAAGVWLAFVACGSDSTSHAMPENGVNAGEAGQSPDATGGTKPGSGGSSSTTTSAGEGGMPASAAGGAKAEGGATGVVAMGGDPAAGDPGGAGGASPCTPGTVCGADGVVTVCGADGSLVSLSCTNGCKDGACLQTDLSTGWILHQFQLSDDSQQATAAYTFSEGGLSALQSVNALPSVYYLDQPLESVEITGQFSVETTSDDDMIGFVFGYQDAEHFYLFDWKQAAQSDGTCGTAEQGAALKVVSSAEALTHCEDFWSSSGNANVGVLVPAASNPTAWLDNTVYDFRLVHQPGHIEIEVRNANTVVVSMQTSDDTYPSGRFGFYNYSQEQSRYQFFAVQPKLK
jgi:hypothetical protein